MVVAEIERADSRIEEIGKQGVGEGWFRLIDWLCVHLHTGIVADRRSGTRGMMGSDGILRTGVVVGGKILRFGLRRACRRLRHLHGTWLDSHVGM